MLQRKVIVARAPLDEFLTKEAKAELNKIHDEYIQAANKYLQYILQLPVIDADIYSTQIIKDAAIETKLSDRWQHVVWWHVCSYVRDKIATHPGKPVPPFHSNVLRSNYNVVAVYLAPENSNYDLYLRVSTLNRRRPMLVPIRLPKETKQAIAAYKYISKSIYLEHDTETDTWAALFTADNINLLPMEVIATQPAPATLAPFFPNIAVYGSQPTPRKTKPKTISNKRTTLQQPPSTIAEPTTATSKPEINISITMEPGEIIYVTMKATGNQIIAQLQQWLLEDLLPSLLPKLTPQTSEMKIIL